MRDWCDRKGLSQRELSDASGVMHGQISRLESGVVRAMPVTIRKLAEALSISREELIAVNPETNAPDSNASDVRQSPRRAVSRDTTLADQAHPKEPADAYFCGDPGQDQRLRVQQKLCSCDHPFLQNLHVPHGRLRPVRRAAG